MSSRVRRFGALAAAVVSSGVTISAQLGLPPDALQQFQKIVGNRIEAVNILGGDYAAAGGIYTFRGGSIADLSIAKIGGSGEVTSLKPLGMGNFQWAPVLQGNLGKVSAQNEFRTGYLAGNRMIYDTLAVEGGVGVSLYPTEYLRLTPTISGLYGRVENEFDPRNANGDYLESVGQGTLVNWTMDTWSVVPALELAYQWKWGRSTFEFSSYYTFFHTESFKSSSPILGVEGNSSTWANKLDVDVPLGLKLLGYELHTGGFLSRTEVFGNAADGFNTDHIYTANGRLVFDFLGKIWAVKWLGVGVSYFWGKDMGGWAAGMDMRLKF